MSVPNWWIQARVAFDEVKAATARAFQEDKTSANTSELSQLEDRILLSASPMAVVAAPEPDATQQESETATPETECANDVACVEQSETHADEPHAIDEVRTQDDTVTLLDELTAELHSAVDAEGAQVRNEVVILDPSVQNSEELQNLLLAQQQDGRDLQFFVLDSERDGIEQIAEILSQYDDLDAVHVLSHGTSQGLQLGNTWLDDQSINDYADQIRGWQAAFSVDGDLLLYGCDLAASDAGRSLVDTLGQWTETDVAASTDLTGATAFGGDWDLEYRVGQIETLVAASSEVQQDWVGLMSVSVDSISTGTSTGGDFSISHTTSGADRLMLVGVALNKGAGTAVTEVTYNGSNLSLVGTQSDGDAVVYIWSLINPSLGTHTVSITVNGTTDGNTAGVMTFTGVDQSTPLGTFASGNGGGGSGSVTVSSAADELVFATISVDDGADYNLTPGSGQTERWDLLGGGDINGGGMTDAGAASVVMDWTWSGSDNWAAAGVSIKPVSSVSPTLALPSGALNYTENDSATVIDAAATASDSDSADLDGGTLTVDFTANGTANDRLAIRNQGTGAGQIGVSGSNVTYAGTTIGTFTGGTDGSTPLVITLNANATPAAAQALMRNITYANVSENPSTAARSVRFVLTDGDGGTSNTATQTVNVIAENDAPSATATGSTLAYTENDGAVVIDSGLSLSDSDSANLTGATVSISTAFASGQDVLAFTDQLGITGSYDGGTGVLSLSGTASLEDYQTALRAVTYANSSDAPSTLTRTVSFVVDDGDALSTAATRNLTVTAVNDAPTITNGAMVVLAGTDEDTTSSATSVSSLLTSASWADVDAGAVSGIAITSTTGLGTWEYSTDNVTWNGVGTTTTSNALLLTSTSYVRYIPDAANGETATLGFKAWDQTTGTASTNAVRGLANPGVGGTTTAYSTGSATASMTVTSVNDAPVLNAAASPQLSSQYENAPAPVGSVGTLISQLVDFATPSGQRDNVTDVDTGAVLGIAITSVDASNGTWYYSVDDGANWLAVGAVSDSSARLLAADANTRIYFHANSNYNGFISHAITFRAWDQVAGTNGATADASVNGSTTAFSAATDTASLLVNDAPVLDNSGSMSLTTITEDEVSNAGNTVASILASAGGDRITDVNTGAVEGIAITALSSGNGAWQYSIDGGAAWLSVGSVSDSSALLLRDTDLVRFVPDAMNSTTPTFTFRAWDQATGSAGTKVNTSTNGTTTPYSVATETASITVTDVNDAPVLNAAASPQMSSQYENASAPVGSVGTLISQLVDFASPSGQWDNVTDVDTGAVLGIATTSVDASNGTWYYSVDDGANWLAIGAVSDSSARLLAADANTRIYFHANSNYNGFITEAITFRAWDQVSGTNGALADSSVNGTTTAFSTATDTASLLVNDAPVLDNSGSMSLTTITEDEVSNAGNTVASILASAGGDRITDVNTGAVEGIAITAANSGNGSWQYSINGGAAWLSVGSVSDSSALLLRDTDLVRFVPDAMNSTAPTFTFRAWDQAIGSAGTKVNTSTNGTTTPYSVATETASITVTDVNDAPVLNNSGTMTLTTINEDQTDNAGNTVASIIASAGGDRITDVDIGASEGIAVTGLVSSNGTWEFSINGGSDWNAIGAVSNTSALLLQNTDLVRFVPDSNNGTAASLEFRAWDQTVGTTGTKVSTALNGGTTEFSAATETAAITVTSVNDAPTITNGATHTFTTIDEDTNSAGVQVSTLLTTAGLADVDTAALSGIAVTSNTGNGTWQYSTDNVTWTAFGATSASNAILLTSTSYVRYSPDLANGETASFSFKAWDQATGTASVNGTPRYANPGAGGGTTAYSSNTANGSITVTSVNDAPTITNGATAVLTATDEDTTSSATLVSSILTSASLADVDTGAVSGMAITSRAGLGTWEYSTDNVTWNDVGTVTASNALLLTSTSYVRYIPDAANGETATLGFKAWDQTTGTASTNAVRGLANPGAGGTTTAFSSQSATASMTVTAVNDSPVLSGANDFTAITEDQTSNSGDLVSALGGGMITDDDSGAVDGIAVTSLNSSTGTWQYSTNNGGSWNAVGAVADNSALLLRSIDKLRFVPDAQNGTTASVTFRAWDQSSGTQGSKVDTTTNGGTTSFSTATASAAITVTDVNDAPVFNLDPNGTPDAWYGGDWQYRFSVSVNHDKVDSDLIDFSMLITEDNVDPEFWNHVKADGSDIVVTAGDGITKLDRDLIEFDTAAQEMVLRVRVPLLSSTVNTDFYLYYGNASAAEANLATTYDSALEVYLPLHEDPSGAGAQMQDRTADGWDGTSTGSMTSTDVVTGQVGDALEFDGVNDRIETAVVSHGIGTGNFTYLAWVERVSDTGQQYQGVMSNGNYAPAMYVEQNGSDNWGGFWGGNKDAGTTVSVGGWQLLTMRRDSGTLSFLNDGQVEAATYTVGNSMSDSILQLGSSSSSSANHGHVKIDEARFYSRALSDHEVAAIFQNESNPSTFYSVGTETSSHFTTSFTENGGPVALTAVDATLVDVDNATLSSLTVTITNDLDGANESLAADTSGTSISASYDAMTSVLTLSGVDSTANYQQVLRTVTYNNISDAPDTTDRVITFVANDSIDDSNVGKTVVTMNALNDAPTFGVGDGAIATDFGDTDYAYAVAVQPDGKFLLTGSARIGGNDDFALARYNIDGSLDTSFGTDGKVTTDWAGSTDWAHGVAVQADGKIVVTGRAHDGSDYDVAVVRYNADGTLDTSFGGTGKVTVDFGSGHDVGNMLELQSDGKIVVSARARIGANDDFAVLRFNTDGTLDTSFGGTGKVTTAIGAGNESGQRMTIQSDGKILVSGYSSNGSNNDFAVVRYNADGSLDTSFGGTGIVTTAIGAGNDSGSGIDVQSDGKIVVGGSSYNGTDNDFAVVRYNADGTLDTSFGGTGKVTTAIGTSNDQGAGLRIQSDGKIVVGGMATIAGSQDFAAVRYNTDGSLDNTFGTGGKTTVAASTGTDYALEMALQADGKVLLAGRSHIGTNDDFAVVRLGTDGTQDTSFDQSILNGTPTYTEDGAPVVLDNDVQVFDAELSAADNFSGATLSLGRNGGTDPQDVFSAVGNLAALTEGGNLVLSGVTIGTVTTNSAGSLLLTFNGNATQTRVDETLQSIAYANTSDTPPGSVQVNWSFNDGNLGAQGTGGPLSATGITTVNITSVNDSPVVATNTGMTVLEGSTGGTITTAMLNEGDVDDSGAGLTYTITTIADHGTLYLNGFGALGLNDTFTQADIDAGDVTYDHNGDEANSDSFDFSLADGGENGATPATGTFNFTITGVNDVPFATANTVTTTEDNAYTFAGGDFTFSDAEGDSLVSVTISNQSLAGGTLRLSGVTVNNGDTILAAQIANLVYTPVANANGTPLATFDFTVNDSDAGVTAAQMDIDVTAVNDVPVATANTVTTTEDNAYTFATGDFTFSDTEGDSLVSVTISNQSLASGTLRLSGVAVNNGDTILAAQIANLVYTPAANATGAPLATFDFTVNDSGAGVTAAQMDIDVTAVNDVPVATANTVTTTEDNAYTFAAGDFTFSDTEGDSLVSVTISNQSLAGGTLRLSGVAVNNGDTILAAQIANLVYTPAANATGAPLATFDFTVNDSGLGVTAAQMDIDVTAVNDVPVATANTVTTSEDNAYTFAASDFTFSDTEGDSLVSVTISNQALAGGTLRLSGVTVNNGDTILAAQIANLVYNPAANATGAPLATFDFTVNDSGSGVTAAQMDIDVTAVNDVPVATANTVTTTEDNGYTFAAGDFTFADIEGDSLVSVTISNQSLAGGALQLSGVAVTNGDTILAGQIANLVYTPAANANGSPLATFDFTVNDSGSGVTAAQMDIDVTAVNDVPVASANTVTTTEDNAYTFAAGDFTFSDTEGDSLVSVTISSQSLAGGTLRLSGVAVNNGDTIVAAQIANLVYTPAANATGAPLATFDFTVNDSGSGVTAAQMDIDVTAVNDVPVASANTVATTEDNACTFAAGDFTFSDIEGDSLVSVTISNQSLAAGTLRLSGVAVNNGDTILAGQIANLVYTPAANAIGAPLGTFDFTVNDSGSGVTAAQMDIDVTAVNDVPVATANTVTTTEDNAYTFAAGDFTFSDTEGDSLVSVTISNQSLAGGTLRLSGVAVNNGDTILAAHIANLVYTPAANANGAPLATFDFTVNDSGSGVTAAQMDIDVTAVNDVPVASANTVTTTEDNAYTFATSDFTFSDIEGDSLVSVTISNQSLASGTLRLSGVAVHNGDTILAAQIANLVYTPAANVTGAPLATFDFTVNDSGAGVTAAQMDIDVTAVNDVPVASANTVTTTEDNAYTFAAGDFTFSDTEGDSLVSVTISNQSLAGGTLRLSGVTVNNGDTILAAQIANLVYTPAANVTGAPLATFDFTVNDSGSGVTAAQMDIDVTAVNDVPVATANTVSTTEDNAYTFAASDFTFSDTEGDSLVSVTISNQSLAGGTLRVSGVAVTNGDTILAAQIANFVYTPAANATGAPLATFDFTVNDSGSGVTAAQMDIDVTAVNDVPVATANTVITTEDNAYTFATGDFTFSDTEGDSLVSVTISNQSLASGTLKLSGVTVNNGDTILAAQIANLVYTPASNATGAPLATFDFTVNDSGSGVTAAQMDIDVTAVNDVPVASANTVTTTEDNAYIFAASDFTFSDTEGDGLVSVTISNQSLAGGTLRLSGVSVNNGDTIAAAQIANLVYTPAANANGAPLATFDFTVNDSGSGVTAAQMDIDVTAVNDVPVATANTVTTTEDNGYTFAAGDFTFADIEGDSLVSVRISNQSLAGGALQLSGVAVNNGDTILAAQIANLVYTPAANANGAPLATFDFTVNDSGSGVTAAQMDIDVTAVNDVPVATANTVSTTEDNAYTFAASDFTFSDTEGDSLVSISISNQSLAGGTLQLSGVAVNNGDTILASQIANLVYTPAENANGSPLAKFDFTVNDSGSGVTAAQMDINVTAVNDVPVATADNYAVDNDSSLNVSLPGILANDSDVEGATLSVSLVTGPGHGNLVVAADGSFTYTPTLGFSGTDSFVYIASDGVDVSAATVVTITVNDVLGTASPGSDSDDPEPADESEGDEDEAELPPVVTTPELPGPAEDGAASPVIRMVSLQPALEVLVSMVPAEVAQEPELDVAGGRSKTVGARGQRAAEHTEYRYSNSSFASAFEGGTLFHQLDSVIDDLENYDDSFQLVAGTTVVASGAISVGVVVWAARAGYFVTMLSSSLPAWAMIDPVAVLDSEALAKRSEKRVGRRQDKSLSDIVDEHQVNVSVGLLDEHFAELATTLEATTRDISEGGMGLVCREPITAENIRLRLTTPAGKEMDVLGNVRHCTADGQNYHVGVSILADWSLPTAATTV